MFSNIYFLDVSKEGMTWTTYVNRMVLPKIPFTGNKDYMRYKIVGWTGAGVLCVAPLMFGRIMLDHTKIIELAKEANFVKKEAIDDVWGKIGASGAIISWKSLRGKTNTSFRTMTAKSLMLLVKLE